MSILINKNTRVLVQGITGREASRSTEQMREYGTKVVAGVTPGKGGQEVSGVKVYDTVREALAQHEADASLIYVPPFAALDAGLEALANGIKLLVVVTERIPLRDSARLLREARERGARVVGPSSVGIIAPDVCKLGPIGGDNTQRIYKPGTVGVVSKSGGMTNETSWVVRQAGFGQSTALGIGGDAFCGTTFAEALELFEADPHTKAVVMFGEPGGGQEETAAALLEQKRFTKPLLAFVAGKFMEKLPEGMPLGHAGALIERGRGTPTSKIQALKKAGALVADTHAQIADKLKEVL